ncbi:PAS domain-containing sensor histidine kinase [Microbacterium terregens]|uniref:histidine kinase n=1 Tax=Microbacterium terregens TaxID=69363 RepID=A0ABV5T3L2_9MICO
MSEPVRSVAQTEARPTNARLTSVTTAVPSRSRSRSIWLWQLSLAGGVVTIMIIGAVLMPSMFASPFFVTGILSIFAITVATLSLPWHRLPLLAVVVIPLADAMAIGVVVFDNDSRFAYLWVFPIAWVATHFSLRWLLATLGMITVFMAIDATLENAPPTSVQRIVVITISLGFLGLATFNGAQHARALRRLLRRHSARLQTTLDRAHRQAHRTTQMFNSLDVGIARIDGSGEIVKANDAFIELYALDRNDLNLPARSIEYYTERGRPLPAHDQPRTRAARGDLLDDEQVWLYDPDGTWHIISVSTRPLPASPGRSSTLLLVQDVSEIHRAEVERRAILAAVSHELRNPLQVVLGHTEILLERDDLAPRVRAQIANIDAAGERMLRMVGENLADARASTHASVEKTQVDVRRVLEASIESFLPAMKPAGMTLELNLVEDMDCLGDAFRLRQVFDNVLNNAVKYTRADGKVTISSRSGAEQLSIRFADSGIGMEADEVPHIFDQYFRGHAARESGATGTGIGMGIVREIVEDHGGTVTVTSEPGIGTTVTVTLARRTANQEE